MESGILSATSEAMPMKIDNRRLAEVRKKFRQNKGITKADLELFMRSLGAFPVNPADPQIKGKVIAEAYWSPKGIETPTGKTRPNELRIIYPWRPKAARTRLASRG